MIVEYHRPNTLEDALELLSREKIKTLPLAGGSILNRPTPQEIAVVDLQNLGLDTIEKRSNLLELGATLTLEKLLLLKDIQPALANTIRQETSHNLRQVASVAGTLVAADGRSAFTTAMLALDANLTLLPEDKTVGIGDLLPVRQERLRGWLITRITIPLAVKFSFQYVARSPADLPLVCVAATQWPSGRTRIALGGYGPAPTLALDGPDSTGAEQAARSAYLHAGDAWASAAYRSEVAGILTRRCLQEMQT